MQSKPSKLTDKGAKGVKKALHKARGGVKKVPGPSTNPATNLLIADVAMRGASILFRRTMEKGLLRARFDPDKARSIVAGRSLGQTFASYVVAKTATKSLPGFVLVTGGLLAKSVFDRSIGRRRSAQEGDETLEEIADNADK